ncbi:uncharacterized protein LOC134181393 [Corticium candelabrum]|uniref:uncharacterized protein LOC134181393 n=1 Tax=Corticium candelabrum TaxID=121492 RepID=UPI002E257628|nr:uncharacterized protein LOC134181393 [Corticium candelabrum]
MKAAIRYTIAVLSLVGMIATWVAMAEIVQDLQTTYPKPYFLTYVVHSGYAFFLITWLVWRSLPCERFKRDDYCGKFGWHDYIEATIWLAFCSFASGYTWYLSLSRTSVSGNTAVYQSQSAFVFLLSVIFLKEKVTVLKVISVVLSLAGVLLIALFPGPSHSNRDMHPSIWGYLLCAMAMLFYVIFEIVYKKKAVHADDPLPLWNAVRVIGLVGIQTLLCYWPVLLILHGTEFEKFELPTGDNLRMLCIDVALDGVYNVLLLVCISMSSPLFATVGLLLVLPVSVVADYVIHKHYTLPAIAFGGVALIALGFVGFCAAEYILQRKEAARAQSCELESSDSFSSSETRRLLSSSTSD